MEFVSALNETTLWRDDCTVVVPYYLLGTPSMAFASKTFSWSSSATLVLALRTGWFRVRRDLTCGCVECGAHPVPCFDVGLLGVVLT